MGGTRTDGNARSPRYTYNVQAVRFSSTKCGVLLRSCDNHPRRSDTRVTDRSRTSANYCALAANHCCRREFQPAASCPRRLPAIYLESHRGRSSAGIETAARIRECISGVPTTPGEYHFTLAVVDSTVPQQQQAQRDLTIIVIVGLTIDWKQPPRVQGNTIFWFGCRVQSNSAWLGHHPHRRRRQQHRQGHCFGLSAFHAGVRKSRAR